MKLNVIITSPLTCRLNENNDSKGILVDIDTLKQIGVSKQFDMQNMAIVDYTPQLDNMERKSYEDRVVELIRQKYSANDELAILRKKLANIDSTEFEEYNAYVEECKAKAKTE